MDYLKSVRNAKFCISDTPDFLNHLIRLETAGIRAFPPEVSPCHFFSAINKPESRQDCMGMTLPERVSGRGQKDGIRYFVPAS